MRFTVLVTLAACVTAQERPFIDVKKVIRDALDMVASVPASTPSSLLDGSVKKQPSILPEVTEKQLSGLFHVPADFLHRLAAQSGYIDYDPYTTLKPRFNLIPAQFAMLETTTAAVADIKQRATASAINEQITGAAFIQEDLPDDLERATDKLSPVKELRYYQPFILTPNHLPQVPQVIQHGGQTYVAVSQAQLNALPAYQPAQSIQYIPSTNSFAPDNLQSSAEVSVTLPETKGQTLFESEADLHSPIKTTKDYDDTLAKVAEKAQKRTADQQRETFSTSSPVRIPAVVDATLNAIPMQKQYSLKDLEAQEYYALQQKILEMNRKMKEQEFRRKQANLQFLQQQLDQQTTTKPKKPSETFTVTSPADVSVDDDDSHPLKKIRISRVDFTMRTPSTDPTDEKNLSQIRPGNEDIRSAMPVSAPASADFKDAISESLAHEERRVETLRKQMAVDRKRFGARKHLSSLRHNVHKGDVHKKMLAASQLTRQHCLNIRSFARQFGILNIREFATANCIFIENRYPELKCNQIERYIDLCYELFDM